MRSFCWKQRVSFSSAGCLANWIRKEILEMSRRKISLTKPSLKLSLSLIVICLITALTAYAQTGSPGTETQGDNNKRKTPPTLSSQDNLGNKTTPAPAA